MFFEGEGLAGRDSVGLGWDVQKQNGCFPLGIGPLLSPAFVHKKREKKDFKLKF